MSKEGVGEINVRSTIYNVCMRDYVDNRDQSSI